MIIRKLKNFADPFYIHVYKYISPLNLPNPPVSSIDLLRIKKMEMFFPQLHKAPLLFALRWTIRKFLTLTG